MGLELLAPAGNLAKCKTALHFGADAVYLSGREYGLRAFADNFTDEELSACIAFAHAAGKKVYVAMNIFARNDDLDGMAGRLRFLEAAGADAVIVSDPGVLLLAGKHAPRLPVHLSTQANTTNRLSARFWAEAGVARIILARELSLEEIAGIRDEVGDIVELEAFVHGAMCISYSGRCYLSNYLAGRDANRGECVQACRWEYELREASRPNEPLSVQEDGRGAYLLNSRDLCLIGYLDRLAEAGVTSFKIEGRMKSEYYVASVTGAYRRALDGWEPGKPYRLAPQLYEELEKTGHRKYTTAGLAGENEETQCYESSRIEQRCEFAAAVLRYDESRRRVLVEMRNRFREGEELEVLSPLSCWGQRFVVRNMTDEAGEPVTDARLVQQRLWLDCPYPLAPLDILRRECAKRGDKPF